MKKSLQHSVLNESCTLLQGLSFHSSPLPLPENKNGRKRLIHIFVFTFLNDLSISGVIENRFSTPRTQPASVGFIFSLSSLALLSLMPPRTNSRPSPSFLSHSFSISPSPHISLYPFTGDGLVLPTRRTVGRLSLPLPFIFFVIFSGAPSCSLIRALGSLPVDPERSFSTVSQLLSLIRLLLFLSPFFFFFY